MIYTLSLRHAWFLPDTCRSFSERAPRPPAEGPTFFVFLWYVHTRYVGTLVAFACLMPDLSRRKSFSERCPRGTRFHRLLSFSGTYVWYIRCLFGTLDFCLIYADRFSERSFRQEVPLSFSRTCHICMYWKKFLRFQYGPKSSPKLIFASHIHG